MSAFFEIPTLSKVAVAANVAARTGLPEKEAIKIMDDYVDTIKELLVEHGEVKICRVGGIIRAQHKKGGRTVRNPKTGEEMPMPKSIAVKWNNNRTVTCVPVAKKNMVYSEFLEAFFNKAGVDFISYNAFNDAIQLVWRDVLEGKQRVEIRGLFTLHTEKKEAKRRNPQNGKMMGTHMRTKINFRLAKALLEKIKERHL